MCFWCPFAQLTFRIYFYIKSNLYENVITAMSLNPFYYHVYVQFYADIIMWWISCSNFFFIYLFRVYWLHSYGIRFYHTETYSKISLPMNSWHMIIKLIYGQIFPLGQKSNSMELLLMQMILIIFRNKPNDLHTSLVYLLLLTLKWISFNQC